MEVQLHAEQVVEGQVDDYALFQGDGCEAPFAHAAFTQEVVYEGVGGGFLCASKRFVVVVDNIFKANVQSLRHLIVNIVIKLSVQKAYWSILDKVNAIKILQLLIQDRTLILISLL